MAISAVERWTDLHARPPPVLSKLDRTTRTLAIPDLTSGDTMPGRCPDTAKNQIDLRSRADRLKQLAALLESLERR